MRYMTLSLTWVRVRRVMLRAVLFAFLWWALTEGVLASWGLGLLAVVAATRASFIISPGTPWRWRIQGMMRFLPVFLWHSLMGSIDVACRALRRPLPLNPMLLVYPWRLPAGPARIFFANTANLLPGTLSAELQDEHLTMHVIDGSQPLIRELQALESQVAALFGLPVPPADKQEAIRDE